MRRLDSITDSVDMYLSKLRETVEDGSLVCCGPCEGRESDVTEQLYLIWGADSLAQWLHPLCTVKGAWTQQNKSQHLKISTSRRVLCHLGPYTLVLCLDLLPLCWLFPFLFISMLKFLKFRKLENNFPLDTFKATILSCSCFLPHHLESKSQHSWQPPISEPHRHIHAPPAREGCLSTPSTLPPASGGPFVLLHLLKFHPSFKVQIKRYLLWERDFPNQNIAIFSASL